MAAVTPTADNPFGYSAAIWRLFRETPHAGEFAPGTPGLVSGEAGSPAARSVLRLQLCFDDGVVAAARFRACGCPTTIAVGAWIAGWSVGRNVRQLSGLQAAELRQALEIAYDRSHCALMGEDALRAALYRCSGELKP
jgi:NifU-like protein involved in Fe-S cluster formation